MSLENIILKAWEDRININKNSDKSIISAINETLEKLDSGTIR
ncbi:MAG: 2,3,4,5-tetrahydropyridine-2,6-dicarboxylate N-succinyltransferase, partial [Betaproteobacteria bacterium]|nr:2,3,4,5-tetrahydropyridine-2,6-dicarboxylate N-succinyltransferase [Betaproteobacteria bacterium]